MLGFSRGCFTVVAYLTVYKPKRVSKYEEPKTVVFSYVRVCVRVPIHAYAYERCTMLN